METMLDTCEIVYTSAVLQRGQKKESIKAIPSAVDAAIQKLHEDTGLAPFSGDTPENCRRAEMVRLGVVMKSGELTGAHETLLKHPAVFGTAQKWVEAYQHGRGITPAIRRMQTLVNKPEMSAREWKISGMPLRDRERLQAADTAKKDAKKKGLPALKGTTKRKTWGEQIRAGFIEKNAGEAERLQRLSEKEPRFNDATFWIDSRAKNFGKIFDKYEQLSADAAKKAEEIRAAIQAEPVDLQNPRGISMNSPSFRIQSEQSKVAQQIDAMFEHKDQRLGF